MVGNMGHVLRSKGEAAEDQDGPHPLHGKGNPVGPLVAAVDGAPVYSSGEELPDDPAQVDEGGEVGP